jgi:putative transposase
LIRLQNEFTLGVNMTKPSNTLHRNTTRWAHFRFGIVGPLLSAPPESGALHETLKELVKKTWTHPITGEKVSFSQATLERWYYLALKSNDPVGALHTKKRKDLGLSRRMTVALKQALTQQYQEHPGWSYQLHTDNLKVLVNQHPELGPMVSYHTVLRYMKANNLKKQRKIKGRDTQGVLRARQRLAQLEVRSYEMDYVNALWHLDFHQGSCRILLPNGEWQKPVLLAIMDDRSRLICHAQWYLDETAETLVHGVMQALQKRGLPRALMSDNGAAMLACEFTSGLLKLGITHETTLPYSPYQNGKQEVFWGQIEGRLLAMLENQPELTLNLLNEATFAWIELEYHQKKHSEFNTTPMARYLAGPDLSRSCPNTSYLRDAFCTTQVRKQRRSDASFSLLGKRYEVPAAFRHLVELKIRYARWDLSKVTLVDPHSEQGIAQLYPQDKSANASGQRKRLQSSESLEIQPTNPTGIAPLLKELMAQFAATGLPPAYIPKEPHHDE